MREEDDRGGIIGERNEDLLDKMIDHNDIPDLETNAQCKFGADLKSKQTHILRK